jgi:hypothetical protein
MKIKYNEGLRIGLNKTGKTLRRAGKEGERLESHSY